MHHVFGEESEILPPSFPHSLLGKKWRGSDAHPREGPGRPYEIKGIIVENSL